MNHNICGVLALASICLAAGSPCSASTGAATVPEALVARAQAQQDIWIAETPPLLMRAEVEVPRTKGDVARGRYVYHWSSPSRWREEVQFPNYNRVRVRDEKGVWQESTLDYRPEIIFQLEDLLDSKGVFKIGPKQTLGKSKVHERNGVREACTEVKWPNSTERILCFDEGSGSLIRIEYPRHDHGNPPAISRIEYSAFQKIGEKLVPFEIKAFDDRKIVVAVKILEITGTKDEDPALFHPPPKSEFWVYCNSMAAPELVSRVQPIYPSRSRSNREMGRVVLYAVIETDGSLSHIGIIHRATLDLEAAAAEAVRQWRYKPAVCGPTPARLETSIPVDFWLED
jgi:TonB family protein